MVLIVAKKQIYKKNALKRSVYMFACERCARKIYTCYTEDTKMVDTQHSSHLNPRWRILPCGRKQRYRRRDSGGSHSSPTPNPSLE